jgi:hypothetical protein
MPTILGVIGVPRLLFGALVLVLSCSTLAPALHQAATSLSMPGVLFDEMQGDIAFSVYVLGESAKPPASLVSQFEPNLKEVSTLPSVCG